MTRQGDSVASRRPKSIHDELLDHEYLNLLASAGRADEARAWAASLAPRVDRWQHRPSARCATRAALPGQLAWSVNGA